MRWRKIRRDVRARAPRRSGRKRLRTCRPSLAKFWGISASSLTLSDMFAVVVWMWMRAGNDSGDQVESRWLNAAYGRDVAAGPNRRLRRLHVSMVKHPTLCPQQPFILGSSFDSDRCFPHAWIEV